VYNIDQQWVADLVEVQNISKYNKGMRYLLMVIDAFSKYAWVEPIKSKTGRAVTEAFKKILKRARGKKPINVQTDDGKEFYNNTFAALMN
jgi:IS30 family transposase